jgi:hypothetical protein
MKICQENPDLVNNGQKYGAVDLINTHQIDAFPIIYPIYKVV